MTSLQRKVPAPSAKLGDASPGGEITPGRMQLDVNSTELIPKTLVLRLIPKKKHMGKATVGILISVRWPQNIIEHHQQKSALPTFHLPDASLGRAAGCRYEGVVSCSTLDAEDEAQLGEALL